MKLYRTILWQVCYTYLVHCMEEREQGHRMRRFPLPPIDHPQNLDLGLEILAWGRLGNHLRTESLNSLSQRRRALHKMGQLHRKALQTRKNQLVLRRMELVDHMLKQVLHRMKQVPHMMKQVLHTTKQAHHRKVLEDLLACHMRGLLPHMKERQVQNMREVVVNHTHLHPLPHMMEQVHKRVQVCMPELACKTVPVCSVVWVCILVLVCMLVLACMKAWVYVCKQVCACMLVWACI